MFTILDDESPAALAWNVVRNMFTFLDFSLFLCFSFLFWLLVLLNLYPHSYSGFVWIFFIFFLLLFLEREREISALDSSLERVWRREKTIEESESKTKKKVGKISQQTLKVRWFELILSNSFWVYVLLFWVPTSFQKP